MGTAVFSVKRSSQVQRAAEEKRPSKLQRPEH